MNKKQKLAEAKKIYCGRKIWQAFKEKNFQNYDLKTGIGLAKLYACYRSYCFKNQLPTCQFNFLEKVK